MVIVADALGRAQLLFSSVTVAVHIAWMPSVMSSSTTVVAVTHLLTVGGIATVGRLPTACLHAKVRT